MEREWDRSDEVAWPMELSLKEDQLVGEMEGSEHSRFAREEGWLNTKRTFFQVRKKRCRTVGVCL
jgi:hypothetical protein